MRLASTLFLVIGAAVIVATPCAGEWAQSEFILGTWFDPCYKTSKTTPEEKFRVARQAGFNLLSGVQPTGLTNEKPESVIKKLNLAGSVGLRSLITDRRAFSIYGGTQSFDSAAAHSVTQYYKDMRTGPGRAQYGYMITDEPHLDELEEVKRWVEHYKTFDDTQLAYFNLLPVYSRRNFPTRRVYEAYLDSFLTDSNPVRVPDVVSFDHYPFLIDSTRTDYFYNLRIIQEKAGARPFWAVARSTAFGRYAAPTLSQLRFAVFSPIAYGAKGLFYFTYEQPPKTKNNTFGTAPVIDCDSLTSVYYDIWRINYFISSMLGPVVMRSDHLGVYHKSSAPTGEAIPDEELMVTLQGGILADVDDENVMVGLFRDRKAPETRYLLVVNKSLFSTQSRVVLVGDHQGSVEAPPSVARYTDGLEFELLDARYEPATDRTTFGINLEGGEGRLIRVVAKP